MLSDPSTTINDGQYIAGIGFVGSDTNNEWGENINTHATGASAAIMVRAAEDHTAGNQAVGMEFRLKRLDDNDSPATSSIFYRINPIGHADTEADDMYGGQTIETGDTGFYRQMGVQASHEFNGSAFFHNIINLGHSTNAFVTASGWKSTIGTGQLGVYWNKTDGEGEVDFFSGRAAASRHNYLGGFDFYDIAPSGSDGSGNTTTRMLKIRPDGIYGLMPAFFKATMLTFSTSENKFIPLASYEEEYNDDSNYAYQRLLMPFSGYVKKWAVRQSGDGEAGNTTVRLWRTSTGTNANLTDDGSTTTNDATSYDSTYQLGADVVVNASVANTSYNVPFGQGYSFNAGDIIGLSILVTSTTDVDEFDGTLVVMFDTTT